jgi:hypothetical protein
LPNAPIPNLTELFGRFGVLIVVRDLGSRKLDAVGQWPKSVNGCFWLTRPLLQTGEGSPSLAS